MALILDTGPLLAALDQDDPYHRRCRDLFDAAVEPLIIPSPVLPELDYLLQRSRSGLSPFLAVLQDVEDRAFLVEGMTPADYARVSEIMARYADARVGFVDAAVLAIVERLNEPKLATLDRRHFTLMRPRHIEALSLLPE